MSFVKKILNIFKPEKVGSTGSMPEPIQPIIPNSPLTNQQLLDQLLDHFVVALKEESVGQRMLYPMSYTIIMHPEDYDARVQSFPFMIKETVAAFYRKIRELSGQYPNYNPPARNWFFQFVRSSVDSIDDPLQDGLSFKVHKGKITTIAQLLSTDIESSSNTIINTNVNVSIKIEGSDVMAGLNFSPDAIKGLDMVSDNIFRIKFDPTLNDDANKIQTHSANHGIAEVSYTTGHSNVTYLMQDNLIHISGSNETRIRRDIFKVENDIIKSSHVQIKHDSLTQKFYIAIFDTTRVNGRAVEMSQGGNIVWHDLANNSIIFFPEAMMSLKFKIKE